MSKVENVQGTLVEVEYQNESKKALLTFLDEEAGQVLEVSMNKQSYEDGEFVDDPEKAARVEEQVKEYFDTTFDKLTDKIGETFTVYKYSNFNAMVEMDIVEKFNIEEVGEIIEAPITEVIDDGVKVSIRFEYGDKSRELKMTYGKWVDGVKKFFPNPVKQQKTYAKFKENFGVDIADKDELIGKTLMAQIELAFKKYPYVSFLKLK